MHARAPGSPRLNVSWIIGQRADPIFLMGGTVVGYAVLAAYARFRFDMVYLWFVWLTLLNGPHLFAMYTRTYLVPDEWRSRPALLGRSLWLFAIGPGVLIVSAALSAGGARWSRVPFIGYLVLVGLWAYWHVVRQHHGIVRLYQRKNEQPSRADYWIDFLLIHVGLTAPLVAFLTRHPELRAVLSLPALAGTDRVAGVARVAAGVAATAVVALFVARQGHRWLTGRALNAPKLLFLAAVVPFYLIVFNSDAALGAPLFAIAPLAIIPHDIQYQAMVWLYNRGRHGGARSPADARGAAPSLRERLTASLPALAACAAGVGALLATASCSLDRALLCPAPFYATAAILPGGITAREILIVAFHGFFIHHYFVDQHIWKPGREPGLAARLGLPAAATPT
jgi:hypothetical protein